MQSLIALPGINVETHLGEPLLLRRYRRLHPPNKVLVSRIAQKRVGTFISVPVGVAVGASNVSRHLDSLYLAQLDAFAHDLFTFLTTGQQVNEQRNGTGKVRRMSHTAATSGDE